MLCVSPYPALLRLLPNLLLRTKLDITKGYLYLLKADPGRDTDVQVHSQARVESSGHQRAPPLQGSGEEQVEACKKNATT